MCGDGCVQGRSPQGVERKVPRPADSPTRSTPEETPRSTPGPSRTAEARTPAGKATGAGPERAA